MGERTIESAFRHTKREEFLPDRAKAYADVDTPITIGYGQTNSQPYTVKLMLEWLAAKPGNKVLDVGSGSGWTTALLSFLVGKTGRVVAVERIPELVAFGRNNCGRLGIQNAVFYQADTSFGWSKDAPYDRILVSAAASEVPPELLDQLAPNGTLVIPVNDDILVIRKGSDGSIQRQSHSGFTFVSLIKG